MKQLIIIAIAILIYGCDKKKSSASAYSYNTSIEEPFKFITCSLLKQPGIGWSDSTINSATNITRVLINPLNKDEVIYAAGGAIYNFNRQTRQKQVIATGVYNFLQEINQFGEILFCDPSFNIRKVKSNGDSLKVYNHGSYESYWDYNGKFIYYHQGNTLYKVNARTGLLTASYPNMPFPLCFSKTSNKLLTQDGTASTLYYKDIDTGNETIVLSNFNVNCLSVTTDNNDNIYWYTTPKLQANSGIFKVDAVTKKIDTLLKCCPYGMIGNTIGEPSTFLYATYVSPKSNQLTMVYQHWIPTKGVKKYTVSYALEMDLTTKKVYEIKGMP